MYLYKLTLPHDTIAEAAELLMIATLLFTES